MTDADQPAAPAVAEEDITSSLVPRRHRPGGADYYVPIFNRFEEANHAGITWNTTAALFTCTGCCFASSMFTRWPTRAPC